MTESSEISVIEPQTSNFHFKELGEIENPATEIIRQLKENIEKGKYSVLISDEAGGRIFTLLLKRIIKRVRPDLSPHAYFVSGGKSISLSDSDEPGEFYDHLKSIRSREPDGSVLLVTQLIHSGDSIRLFTKGLKDAGFREIDVASLSTLHKDYQQERFPEGVSLFAGDYLSPCNQ